MTFKHRIRWYDVFENQLNIVKLVNTSLDQKKETTLLHSLRTIYVFLTIYFSYTCETKVLKNVRIW